MGKSYVIGIGAPKAATTSLFDVLKHHPDLCASKIKETHFFSNYYDKGLDFYYKKYFHHYNNEVYLFECSTGYLPTKSTAKRIRDSLEGTIKIIAMIRQPVDRAYSHYRMTKSWGIEKRSFVDAFYNEEESEKAYNEGKSDYMFHWDFKYKSNGLYFEQLEEYYKVFPKEDILVILYDDFAKNQEKVISEVTTFLGIKDSSLTLKHSNKGKVAKYPSITRLFYKRSKFKEVFKKFSPLFFRNFLRKLLLNTTRKEGSKDVLSLDVKKELTKVYQEDINHLISNYHLDVEHWLYENE